MNETLVKNTFHHAKPQFDSLKNSLSDNAKHHKNTYSEQTSFDTYLSNNKPQKPIKKASVSEKPQNYSAQNQTKKLSQQKNDSDNDNKVPTSDSVDESKTTETDNKTTKNKEKISQDTTEDTLGTVNGFILNITETMPSLPQNTLDDISISTDLTGLDTTLENGASNTQPEQLAQAISLNTDNNTEFTLDLDLDETTTETSEDTESEGELSELSAFDTTDTDILKATDTPVNNNHNPLVDKSDIQNLTHSDPSAEAVNNVFANHSTHNNLHIQIEKATQVEVIAQLPLKNDISLSITKDADNDNKIGINLEPAGMGDVELVIETNKDNAVTAVIRSDKPEILEQLRKESASLERYLTEAGLNLGGQGLGFEHKQQPQDDNQNSDNNNNQLLNATISETSLSKNNISISATEKLYATLDRQSIQTGMDIRL